MNSSRNRDYNVIIQIQISIGCYGLQVLLGVPLLNWGLIFIHIQSLIHIFRHFLEKKRLKTTRPLKHFENACFFFFWISDATKTAESTSARRKSLTVSVCSLNDLITSLQFDDDVVGCKSPHSRLMCSSSRPMFPPCSLSCGSWYVFFFFFLL